MQTLSLLWQWPSTTWTGKVQNEMRLCAAKCCQDGTSSVGSAQRCVDRCSEPMIKTQKYVQHELEEFQGRLQRWQCQDDVKVEMPPNPNKDQMAKFQ